MSGVYLFMCSTILAKLIPLLCKKLLGNKAVSDSNVKRLGQTPLDLES